MSHGIVEGAGVFTADGHELGHVKKVEASSFQVNVPRHSDYWLESSLVLRATTERVELTVNESDLSGYKMDRPHDPNGFQENVAKSIDPATVRGDTLRR